MRKFMILALLAMAATTLQASTISSSAYISCSNCVTVSLRGPMSPLPFPVEVQASTGQDLFPLNTGAPATTGAINPDPQTVSGLSSTTLNIITNGKISATSELPQANVTSNLLLLDNNGDVIQSTPFVAQLESVPEPAAWSLVGGGLGLVLLGLENGVEVPRTQGRFLLVRLAALASLATFAIFGQTTQGLISGRLLDSRSGRAIVGAHIACSEESTGVKADGVSDGNGFYVLPLLPPGSYSIRVTASDYQSQEAQDLSWPSRGVSN